MHLKNKTDAQLVIELKGLRKKEKDVVAEILHYLLEVEMRQLFLERGFSSMYAFCRECLGYSKDEAHLRIQAMRLMGVLPQVEEKIRKGDLSLTAAAKTQSAFRQEDQRRRELQEPVLTKEEKAHVVAAVAGKSCRESERALATFFPEVGPVQEKTKVLDAQRTMIQFAASNESMAKYERLKELLAHKNFSGKWDLLFDELADIALKKLDPKAKAQKPACKPGKEATAETRGSGSDSVAGLGKRPEGLETAVHQVENVTPAAGSADAKTKGRDNDRLSERPKGGAQEKSLGARRKYISVHVRRQVQQRAAYCCEYVDAATERRCGATHALEIDHLVPVAMGGGDEIENLRLLCDSHNRYLAWRLFGERHCGNPRNRL